MNAVDLLLRALRVDPASLVAPSEVNVSAKMPASQCALTGVLIPAGAPRRRFNPSKEAFTNWSAVRGDCITLPAAFALQKTNMVIAQRCVISEEGIFPAATFRARAALLLEPPQGPIAWLHSTQSQAFMTQHLVWRAQVSFDAENLFYVCWGGVNYPIRRKLVMEAVAICRLVVDTAVEALAEAKAEKAAAVAAGKKQRSKPAIKPKAYAIRHPFLKLDAGWQNPNHGVLRSDFSAAALTRGLRSEMNLLGRLTSAEKCMLFPLLFPEKHIPERPTPITAIPPPKKKGGETAD